ncbi:MAG: type II toxin-antitoxin system VapC family toxin [Methylobacter sp.]|uniref:type II toxin-antitoxin system VapC family toxin n=1 Tax=Methylobacter sp. TaxID=2051955 RepID=UPI0027320396|nr:type II toxin-antitoxin system VapC family toxin [Methylobacter sp.]MDP1666663.1 type II toxin-antitoxin system VapC family toxin [Methylobacter sp.]MDP1969476.1 type II toxin-antitoxin system VapC family toxin [Methylobacter sp.]
MNALLIDTNIYSHAMRGDTEIIETLRQVAHIGITAISIGELLSGFKAGIKKINRQELNQFLDSPRVALYGIDEQTAEYYCLILDQLKNNGTPIPTNDIWIAAVAFQQGMPVYTKDQHFTKIKGLLFR